MTSNTDRVSEAVAVVRRFHPGYKIAPKSKSLLHSIIGKFFGIFGNHSYTEDFWTTIGQTSAYPKPRQDEVFASTSWSVVCHEGQHVRDGARIGWLAFSTAYLFPQVLAGLALLSIFSSSWFLLGLIALLPLPAIGRTILELRAYKVSVALDFWTWGDISGDAQDSYIEGWLVKEFCGSNYYWMWPFKPMIRNWFLAHISDLRHDEVVMTPYLVACKELALKYGKEDGWI